jgi:CheY-like chemotaxis protein
VEGAPDRLQQVVWNLLMNSVKFTPAGGRVEVASQRRAGTAAIVVTDSGQGIAPELLPHVFDLFRQADSSSTRTHGGLGLGLTLVRRLVELHGGQVVAESAGEGRGATFTVTLPLPAAQRTLPAADEPSPAGGNGRQALAGIRILVVDDDPEFLDLAALIFRRAGAEVRTVAAAARAYELVEAWLPDVLLTDLAMPGEDGFMLATAMRTLFTRRRAQVPIIAVTAFETPESRARARLAGFDLYLTKPVDPADLTGAVAGIVRRGT